MKVVAINISDKDRAAKAFAEILVAKWKSKAGKKIKAGKRA